jgi:hypothetical protein
VIYLTFPLFIITKSLIMTNEQKAQLYNKLLFDYHQLGNKIAALKSENLDPSPQTLMEIKRLEKEQQVLMGQVQRLMM